MANSDAFVSFDIGATAQEVDEVERLFTDADVAATVSEQPYSLVASVDVNVDAFVVVTTAATGFLTVIAAKAGADAYEALKTIVIGLRAARKRDHGRIEIVIRAENDGSPDIVIGPDAPPEALRALLTGELPAAPSGAIEYDPRTRRWVDSASQQ